MAARWQMEAERWPTSTRADRVLARADAVEEVAHVIVADVEALRRSRAAAW